MTERMLTARQIEFLSLSANGFRQVDIADQVSLSPWTVKDILEEARSRLRAKTTTEAVVKAIALEYLVLHHDGITNPAMHDVPPAIVA